MSALRDGLRRVHGAPAILLGMWALTVATLPLALTLRGETVARRDSSLLGATPGRRIDDEWLQEFSGQPSGLAAKTVAIGFGAVLDDASALTQEVTHSIPIVISAAAYLALWLFVTGGIIDRYARDRPAHAYGFFSACGGFSVRFLRLGLVMVIVYGFLFGSMHPWLFDRLYPRMVRDVQAARTAFAVRAVLYGVFFAVLAGCNLIFDYAKVRAVVEDRRSMLGAIAASARFIGSHYAATVSLYAADLGLLAVVVGAYALLAPEGNASIWTAVVIGQAYVVARLWVMLVFWASETALFQSRLAHARYIARPAPQWPDSPEAEAIGEV
jgi:hypothetical protein